MTQPVYTSDGGARTFTQYSGTAAANDVLIYSGAGRLNQVMPLTAVASGQSVFFYDSALATSGGPFAASGHKIVGYIPTTWSGFLNAPGLPVLQFDMPFQSGLCAATRSGGPGFTVSYTPEVAQM